MSRNRETEIPQYRPSTQPAEFIRNLFNLKCSSNRFDGDGGFSRSARSEGDIKSTVWWGRRSSSHVDMQRHASGQNPSAYHNAATARAAAWEQPTEVVPRTAIAAAGTKDSSGSSDASHKTSGIIKPQYLDARARRVRDADEWTVRWDLHVPCRRGNLEARLCHS